MAEFAPKSNQRLSNVAWEVCVQTRPRVNESVGIGLLALSAE